MFCQKKYQVCVCICASNKKPTSLAPCRAQNKGKLISRKIILTENGPATSEKYTRYTVVSSCTL